MINECIICHSKDVKPVKRDMKFERKNPGTITVHNQECTECQNCGEQYFDEEQMEDISKKIDKGIKSS